MGYYDTNDPDKVSHLILSLIKLLELPDSASCEAIYDEIKRLKEENLEWRYNHV